MNGLKTKASKTLLELYVYGSWIVLFICLFGAAVWLSSVFIKKEQQRSNISKTQLSHFFEFQYRAIAEEMWTGSFESIGMRVGQIAKQFGNAEFQLLVADSNANCIYVQKDGLGGRTCELPSAFKAIIQSGQLGNSTKSVLNFDGNEDHYVYMASLAVGAMHRGYLMATLSDPYDFFRGKSWVFAQTVFLPVFLSVLFLWMLWLFASRKWILKPYLSNLVELEKNNAVATLAARVAHDIQSPLATLSSVVERATMIDPRHNELLMSAAARIHNIANDLLSRYKNVHGEESAKFAFVAAVIDSIVAEKIVLLNSKCRITSNVSSDLVHEAVPIAYDDLARMLSNLINNSIDACGDHGFISVVVTSSLGPSNMARQIKIEIKDTGNGMDKETLNRVLTIGGSFNKIGGAGIGIQTAKQLVSSVGGVLTINSIPRLGTTVTLLLPTAPAPTWLAKELIIKPSKIIVMEDDESVIYLWKEKFADKECVFLKSPADFKIDLYPKDEFFYIFDQEFSSTPVTGLDIIKMYALGHNAVLATSYYNNLEIQKAAKSHNFKILPKFMISKILVEDGTSSRANPDLVLIDDESLVRDTWSSDSMACGKALITVANEEEFLKKNIEYDTPVYIDKNLAGASGVDVAERLSNLGYKNIFLTTGENAKSFIDLPFLSGVIGKRFPKEHFTA